MLFAAAVPFLTFFMLKDREKFGRVIDGMLSRRDGIVVQALWGGDEFGYGDDREVIDRAEAERGVNIAGIVGIAEDTNGELMLETSDADATRAAFDSLGLAYEAHDADGGMDPGRMLIADVTTR